jgi:hypothetical protein
VDLGGWVWLTIIHNQFALQARPEKTKFDRPQRIGYKMQPLHGLFALIPRAQGQSVDARIIKHMKEAGEKTLGRKVK